MMKTIFELYYAGKLTRAEAVAALGIYPVELDIHFLTAGWIAENQHSLYLEQVGDRTYTRSFKP